MFAELLKPKGKAINSWSAWLSRRRELRQRDEVLRHRVGEAKRRREGASAAALPIATQAADLVPGSGARYRNHEDRKNLLASLAKGIDYASEHSAGNAPDLRQAHAELASAIHEEDRAREVFEQVQTDREELLADIEDHDAAQPSISHQALTEIDKERERLSAEAARVGTAMEGLGGDKSEEDGPAAVAQRAAEQAQATLDDLEADAALGTVDESEKRAAVTALTRARKNAQEAREAAARNASALRGLEAKQAALDERIKEMEMLRAEVASRVYAQDVEEAEHQLVALLEGKEITEVMARLKAAHRQMGDAQAVVSGMRPGRVDVTLEINLPSLIFHPERRRLNGGIRIPQKS